jgi:hypothetical protein
MRRRELLGSLAAVAALQPLVALAQDSTSQPVVAVLIGASSKAATSAPQCGRILLAAWRASQSHARSLNAGTRLRLLERP